LIPQGLGSPTCEASSATLLQEKDKSQGLANNWHPAQGCEYYREAHLASPSVISLSLCNI